MASQRNIEMLNMVKDLLENNEIIVLVSFKGLKAQDDNKLRRILKKEGITFKVVKNTILNKAFESLKIEGLEDYLKEDTALVVGEDLVHVVKAVNNFSKEHNGLPKFKAVYYQGKVYVDKDIEAISKLPTREELLARVVGGVQAPISGLVFVLSGLLRNLVGVIKAIEEKKSKEG